MQSRDVCCLQISQTWMVVTSTFSFGSNYFSTSVCVSLPLLCVALGVTTADIQLKFPDAWPDERGPGPTTW